MPTATYKTRELMTVAESGDGKIRCELIWYRGGAIEYAVFVDPLPSERFTNYYEAITYFNRQCEEQT